MSIIGDQLITDKLVALVEIVKNSYDADARKVTVRFGNWVAKPSKTLPLLVPYIEIEDDGSGMDEDTLLNIFLNPGTPNKLLQKKEDKKTPLLGRTMQGEKGIGRFAINKLGTNISIYSKTLSTPEVELTIDFDDYDNDSKTKIEDFKLLEQIQNDYVLNDPPVAIKEKSGTIIRISNLKQHWSQKDFNNLSASLQKLVAPPDILREQYFPALYRPISDFSFLLEVNGIEQGKPDDLWRHVLGLAPFRMIGSISAEGILAYKYVAAKPFAKRTRDKVIDLTNKSELDFQAPALKRYFSGHSETAASESTDPAGDEDTEDDTGITEADSKEPLTKRVPQQGPVEFSFYVYDVRPGSPATLNKIQKEFVDNHSVFVFRDGIRVYPFGEKTFDWLELLRNRGEVKAGWFYSFQQVIGFVYITGKDNPKLKDTTSRYGLMDVDGAYNDFQVLVAGALNAMKAESDIDIRNDDLIKDEKLGVTYEKVTKAYSNLSKEVEKSGDEKLIATVQEFKKTLDTNNNLVKEKIESYEDLAGLGLAVEKSSHDAIMVLRRSFGTIEDLKLSLKASGLLSMKIEELIEELKTNIDIVYNELQVIQPLFRVSRRNEVTVSIREAIEKAIKYFRHELTGITVQTNYYGELEVESTQGLLLQVLINLIDNAIYWLKYSGVTEKLIAIEVNAKQKTILISDNGPGISEELSNIVFEAFFSRKDSGRGLGLYITREMLARMGATIRLTRDNSTHHLPGANFLIKFQEA